MRRDAVGEWLHGAPLVERPGGPTARYARSLAGLGISTLDAVHLAWAATGRCSAFLTVDERLLRKCERMKNLLRISVMNPVDYVRRGEA